MRIDWGAVITADDKAAAAKAQMQAEIAARRYQAMTAGVTVEGWQIQSDDQTLQRLRAASALLGPNETVEWRFADGTTEPMEAWQLDRLARGIFDHWQACFAHEAQLFADLDAGVAIDIETGWPQ